MSVIFLLIPVSVLFAACFLGAFFWAVKSGQYEDTTTPSMRMLLDQPGPENKLPIHGKTKGDPDTSTANNSTKI